MADARPLAILPARHRPMSIRDTPIPAIDLFAGPGGLGEGFARCRSGPGKGQLCGDEARFSVRLSIEKEALAHRTLELRAFYRQFPEGRAPAAYYDYLRRRISRADLFARHEPESAAAMNEAIQAELGAAQPGRAALKERVNAALRGAKNWVLLGGPPCQAYSLVGRSRNKGKKDYVPEEDHRQTLYLEYLQVIADHWPAVFVMENVKGMVSRVLNG